MNVCIIERNGDITEQVSSKKMKPISDMLHIYFKGTFKWNSLIDNQSWKHIADRKKINLISIDFNMLKVEKLSEVNTE